MAGVQNLDAKSAHADLEDLAYLCYLVHLGKCNFFDRKCLVYKVVIVAQVTRIGVILVNANEFSIVSCPKMT